MSGAATSATLEIINTSVAFGGNDFAIDDISFSDMPAVPAAVPEAGTWITSCLVAGFIAVRYFRRRVPA
jgi:hypothetical protein